MRSQQGFTLLELLLVIAVMAVMSVAGLAAYQQRITDFKVQKTALQMQQILQAAQAYYMDHSATWPDTTDPCCTGQTQLATYLSGTPLETCPWMAADPNNLCYNIAVGGSPSTPNANFSVSITIPSTVSSASSIAQMIAARLPNASVVGNKVTAQVSKTAIPPTPTTSGLVKSVQYFQSSQAIHFANSCDAGLTQVIYFSISGVTSPGYEGFHPPNTYSTPYTFAVPIDYAGWVADNGDRLTHPTNYAPCLVGPIGTFTPQLIHSYINTGGQTPPTIQMTSKSLYGVAIETCQPTASVPQNCMPSPVAQQSTAPPKPNVYF